jgi:SAM-dependent methyltransferase
MLQCKICGNAENNKIHIAQERMFGFGGDFEYLECSNCNCIQLLNIPRDLGKYYPQDQYYSLSSGEKFTNKKSLSNTIRQMQSDYLLFGKRKFIGNLLSIGYSSHDYFNWLKKVHANYNTEILDVGCGGGELLFRMRRNGFKNLTGNDPFNTNDIHSDGVNIYKKEIYDLQGTFDFIMLNHSFEHMDQPLRVLKKLYELLNPKSYLLIRIPVSNSYCWQQYGVFWAPLDAPRHLYIQSEKSMNILSNEAGFEIKDIIHDGTAFQFWGSEQYKRSINLRAENSYEVSKEKSIFTKAQINEYKKRIKELNAQHLGGQAQFYLYKK